MLVLSNADRFSRHEQPLLRGAGHVGERAVGQLIGKPDPGLAALLDGLALLVNGLITRL